MGKFSFTGRKKQPPQVTVTAPPMSKAQKILGSTVINVDDEFSSSKTSLTLPDRSGIPSRTRSLRASPRAAPDWGDESDIIPRHFHDGVGSEAYGEYDDMSSSLQKRQSSASLNEWYDKAREPLSVSQQTSNSAMAKGLPSKAHRMLDMDHTQSNVKSRTKPSRLDLTHIMSRKSKKNERPAWEGPVLGAEHLTRSPSILSPLTPPGIRGKLKKRPTKESLQSVQSGPRTGGSDSSRRGNHLDGLPNLYEHYEQMSFRHVMEEDLNAMEDDESVHEPILEEVPEESYEEVLDGFVDNEMDRAEGETDEERYEEEERQTHLEPLPSKMYNVPVSKSAQNLPLPHHAEHIISQYARRTLPQTPQAAILPKTDMSSPTDCAASVSSRHTRTSKASKRTDQSLHESDLQEKSMLMLSSDSEDETYDPSFKGPASVPDYPVSDSGSVFDQRPTTARTSQSADNKRASKASRVTSTSNSSKFLAIPSGHPTAGATRFSSLSGSSNNTIQEVGTTTLARSPSAASCMTNSSVNTTMTWQSKVGLGLHQARAVTVQSARGPDEHDVESVYSQDQDQEVVYEPVYEPVFEPVYEPVYEHDQEHEHDHEADDELETSHIQASTIRDSIVSGGDQPTPPLSPSSVDFYIDGNAAHGRFMAVTRQEEMLLSALRHKRQIMRETILNEMEDNARAEGRMPRGHMSKPSEATIAESHFELDFPAPPMCKNKTTVTADGTTIIDLRRGSSVSQFHPSPNGDEDIPDVPALPLDHQGLKGQREARNNQHERILLYLDHPLHDQDGPIEESEPSPDLSDFMEFDAEESESGDGLSEVVLYPTQMHRRGASRSSSKRRSGMVKPLQLKSNTSERVNEYGIPRPDSPISPDPMTSKPRRGTINSRTARLSAVGPARWGYED